MRRALLEQLPAFSHVFGIHPWDVDRLTLREVNTYSRVIDEMQEAQDG